MTARTKPWPSLGGQVCQWMETYLVHGPGDIAGQPYLLDDEQRAFVWRAYEVFPRRHERSGRRRFRRAVLSRRKGRAKTELAGAIAAAELLGPVRCNGWDAAGEPVGVPVFDPDIPCAATGEEQAEDTVYGAFYTMVTEGPLANDVDPGLKKTQIIGRPGNARVVTSSSVAREGGRPTFIPADETHLWYTPGLIAFHRTLRRNLRKRGAADPWMLETSTMYRPGEGSVAEGSHEYAGRVASGEISDASLLFDHLQAGTHHDLSVDEDYTDPDTGEARTGLRSAILEASGLAAPWTDVDAIIDDFRDPQNELADGQRYWLNQAAVPSDQWVDPDAWKACAKPDRALRKGDRVALGFDGSLYEDATALVATRLRDLFQVPVGIWEKPEGPIGEHWQVPSDDVDGAVAEAFDRYRVVRFYADPPYWQSEVDGWAETWGDVVVRWWTNRETAMARALERYNTAIVTGSVTHDGDAALGRHIANARRRRGRAGTLIRKPRERGPDKIDAAMAACLSHEAAADAIAEGALRPKRKSRHVSL